MKLFAPRYYRKFKCIAGECRHSCCVSWEIDVDADALSRYRALGEAGEEILKSIDFGETPHFCLTDTERCPHLNSEGLCRIIIQHGEGYLSQICREHPRFYNSSPFATALGVGMACEAAAKLILSSDDYMIFEDASDGGALPLAARFAFRKILGLYKILSNRAIAYNERLSRLWNICGISPRCFTDEEWRGVISELEFIDEKNRELFYAYSTAVEAKNATEEIYSERALAYFLYRHCFAAKKRAEFLRGAAFAFFCERLYASLLKNADLAGEDEAFELARKISEELEYSTDNTDFISRAALNASRH